MLQEARLAHIPDTALVSNRFNPLPRLRVWHEQRHVARSCRRLLRQYQALANAHPDLEGPVLYRMAVAAHLGDDGAAADEVLVGAQVSYADWPTPREVCLRDVARYLAVLEFRRSRWGKPWITSDLEAVVMAAIPPHL